MSKKISLFIGGRNFDVDVNDEFEPFLKHKIAQDFSLNENNDLKVLVQAYVKKNHEIYLQEQQIKEITDLLDNLA
jgi:hypothetical protein